MDDEEIGHLLQKSEWKAKLGLLSPSLLSWGLWLGFIPWFYFSSFREMVAALFFVHTVVSGCATGSFWGDLKRFQLSRALLLWQSLKPVDLSADAEEITMSTYEFGSSIEDIYLEDQQGEMLPLSQAVRLYDLHNRQQQRLRAIEVRLGQSALLRSTLKEKMQRLHELQEKSDSGERTMRELEESESGLEEVRSQLLASCRRLEIILLSVRNAIQVRTLHKEVLTLSQNSPMSLPEMMETGGVERDLESQISREVETYLSLERETDRQLS